MPYLLARLVVSGCPTYKLNLFISDIGRQMIIFNNIQQLLNVRDDERFSSIIASTSCLVAIAETNISEEVSQLIDFMTDLRVTNKRLLVLMSTKLDINLLNGKRTNFNVLIIHLG